MAADSFDSTTGAPIFAGTGAPDTGVDLTLLGEFAAKVGTRLMGTTAERTSYSYAREGLEWYDTDLDAVYLSDGSGWQLWHKRSTSYTPTTTNVSGSPATTARYSVAAGIVHVEIEVTLAGANFGSAPRWSLPVEAASEVTLFAGLCWMFDTSGSLQCPGGARVSSGDVIPYPFNATGTYDTTNTATTATVPFTWASGDVLTMSFDYTAA